MVLIVFLIMALFMLTITFERIIYMKIIRWSVAIRGLKGIYQLLTSYL